MKQHKRYTIDGEFIDERGRTLNPKRKPVYRGDGL